MLATVIELLALATCWGAFTWHAQTSGEMLMFPFPNLRRRKLPWLFFALLGLRWLQVAALAASAVLFAVGILPLQ